jgi:hypothetical protein
MAGLRLYSLPPEEERPLTPYEQAVRGVDSSGGEFGRGVTSGLLGAFGGGYNATAGAFQEAMGGDPTRSYDTSRGLLRRAGQAAPIVNNWDKVNGVGDFLDYAAGAAGQGLASTAPGVAATLLTRSPRVGLATMFPMEMGESVAATRFDPSIQQPDTATMLSGAATKGAVNTAIEAVPFMNIFGRGPLRPLMKAATMPARAGGHMLAEGGTELAQQRVGQLAQDYMVPGRDTSEDNMELREAFLQGTLGATPFAGMSLAGHAARDAGVGMSSAIDKLFPAKGEPTALDDLIESTKSVGTKLKEKFDPVLGKDTAETMENLRKPVDVDALNEGKQFNLMRPGVDTAEDDIKKKHSFLRQQLGNKHTWLAEPLAKAMDRYLRGDTPGGDDAKFKQAILEAFDGNVERANGVMEHFAKAVEDFSGTLGERTTIYDTAREPSWGDREADDDTAAAPEGPAIEEGGQEYTPKANYRFAGTGRLRPYENRAQAGAARRALGAAEGSKVKVRTMLDWAQERGKDPDKALTDMIGGLRYDLNDIQKRLQDRDMPKEQREDLLQRSNEIVSLLRKAIPTTDPDTGEITDSATERLSKLFVLRGEALPADDLTATSEEIAAYADKREAFGGAKGAMVKFRAPNGKVQNFNARQILDLGLKSWSKRNPDQKFVDGPAHWRRVYEDGIARLTNAGYVPDQSERNGAFRPSLVVRDGETYGGLVEKTAQSGQTFDALRDEQFGADAAADQRAILSEPMQASPQEIAARKAEGWVPPTVAPEEQSSGRGDRMVETNLLNRESQQGPEGNVGEGFDPTLNTLRDQDPDGPRLFDENIVNSANPDFAPERLEDTLAKPYMVPDKRAKGGARKAKGEEVRVSGAPLAQPQAATGSNLEKLQGLKDHIEAYRANLEQRGIDPTKAPTMRLLLKRMAELEAERTKLTKEDVAAEESVADTAAREEANRALKREEAAAEKTRMAEVTKTQVIEPAEKPKAAPKKSKKKAKGYRYEIKDDMTEDEVGETRRLELINDLKKAGGVNLQDVMDVIGERKARGVKVMPGLFTKTGMRVDMLAEWMAENGYIADESETDKAWDIVRAATDKQGVFKIEDQDDLGRRRFEERANKEYSRMDLSGGAGQKLTADERQALIKEIVRLRGTQLQIAFKEFAQMGPAKLDAKGNPILDANGDPVRQGASGEWSKDKTAAHAQKIITLAVDIGFSNAMSVAHHEAVHDFFAALRSADSSPEMRNIAMTIERVAELPHIRKQLETLLKKHPEALEQLKNPEERAAYLFQFWKAGLIKDLAPSARNWFERLLKFLRDVLGIVSLEEKGEKLMLALDAGKFTDASTVGRVVAQMKLETAGDKLQRVAPALWHVGNVVMASVTDRMRLTEVPAIMAIADRLHRDVSRQTGMRDDRRPGATKADRRNDPTEQTDFLDAKQRASGIWYSQLLNLFQGADKFQIADALEALQSQEDSTDPMVVKIRAFLKRFHEYLSKADVMVMDDSPYEKIDSKGKTVWVSGDAARRWVPIAERQVGNYFPRSWDREKIMAHKDAFVDLIVQKGREGNKTVTRERALEIFDTMTSAEQDEIADGAAFTPYLMSANTRALRFITKDNAKDFAKFQKKDMVAILSTYTYQAVHRAEFTRYFGHDGQWIREKLAEAEAQGATPEQMATARKGVEAMLGSLGRDMTEGTRKLMTSLMAYENIVLLPLALVNNFMDVLQIGLRTGDLTESFNAMKQGVIGLKRQIMREGPDEAEQFSRLLGMIDENVELASYGMLYDGHFMGGMAKKVSDKFFRWNGMATWNTRMRVAATQAGVRFIERHADKALKGDEQSIRWLKELGLEKSDVRRDSNGKPMFKREDWAQKLNKPVDSKEVIAAADRMQKALFLFVDSAVIRPSAAHRPIWGSDPHWMLVFHLKQFTYSFQQVVLKYTRKELQHGNSFPAIALMMYVPFAMVTDLTRSAIVGRPIDFSLSGLMGSAVRNSAVLGTGTFGIDAWNDLGKNQVPGASFLGPTAGHAIQLLQTIAGSPQDSMSQAVLRSLPASPILRGIDARI